MKITKCSTPRLAKSYLDIAILFLMTACFGFVLVKAITSEITSTSESVTLTVAISALFSPLVTAAINNQHARAIKKIEYEHDDKVRREEHERDIFEGYIRAAGACIQCPSEETGAEYGRHSALVSYYVPDYIRSDILELEALMQNCRNVKKPCMEKLATISSELRKFNISLGRF